MSQIPLTDEHLELLWETMRPDLTYNSGYELTYEDVTELLREVRSWRHFAEHAFKTHSLPDICCPDVWTRR